MDSPSVLTAAECATRTGLTPRALRLYEELGLITPRRSPGGWRQYGPRELVRLNVITLLKTAGLTLAQIAGLMGPGTQDPDLRPMLSIQLENWRARRADAERGQRIAETGAIKSIEFQGVGAQGWDVYDVHHERGTARMRIMLRADGMITGALFVVKDGPASLGP
jgi:DNA-binding transcriptional MerR regulator